MHHHSRLQRIAALAVTVAALAAPVASAQQDLRSPDARDAARVSAPSAPALAGSAAYPSPTRPDPALAQERYYSSYGDPEPVIPSPQPASPDGGIGWLPVVLLAASGVLVVAGGSWSLRRVRVRRRALA
jgi:hypothetical protein